jgi:hypothetical protein
MNRRALLIITGCLAAAGASAEPRAEDGVVDPWAPIGPLPVAAWSPAPIALIVNPWGEQTQRRIAPPAPRSRSSDSLDQIVDPWGKSQTDRSPRLREPRPELGIVEVVDPWADRPRVARAAFPAEGVIDPWQGRAITGPARQ